MGYKKLILGFSILGIMAVVGLLFAASLWRLVHPEFLGKWEIDLQKTYEKDAKVRQLPADRQEYLKKASEGRKMEIFANGEIISTFKEYPEDSDELVTRRAKYQVLKSTPTELKLKRPNEVGLKFLYTINHISDEYITLFAVLPGEKADDQIRYYFKKVL